MAVNDQISQEDFNQLIQEVNHKAFQSLEFLSTTLAWAKANFDSIALQPETVSLSKLVTDTLLQYDESISLKKIQLKISLDKSITIATDKEILNTVLRNLISNAIKFSFEQGSITITSRQAGSYTTLEIADHGIGMEKEKIEQIHSYQQHSSIGTFGEKGLGIGLMLCQDLLHHTGSRLVIESQVGVGTTMKILIHPMQ
jgi:signal transduction histidine kinase